MQKSTTSAPKYDVHQEITNKILKDLEAGTRPWVQPWTVSGCTQRPIRSNGVPYNGINVLLLWSAAIEFGYNSPRWMTFKQSLELGGCVRKGEKSEKVIFYKTLIKEAETEDDDDRVIPMARAYSVFNVEQIDGLPEHYYTKSEPLAPIGDRNADLDAWIANTGADIRHGGAKAFYQPTNDFIQMPNFEAFSSVEAYYATHLHELTHWTKKGNRLDRDLGRKQWGDEGYAREELVAEIGSAFLCADLNVSNVIRDDHSSYIDAWIKVLKGDKRAIFQAASMATKAAEYLHSLQVKEESKAA